jgi:hypothetical protein
VLELIPGFTLVHEVDYYPGVFRDVHNKIHDLRPNGKAADGKVYIRPSLKSFSELPQRELQNLLLKAYKEQIAELEKEEHEVYDSI